MFFNSLHFAVFLPIIFILYWFVFNKNKSWQNSLLKPIDWLKNMVLDNGKMSEKDFDRRLSRLEESHQTLESSINELNTTLLLLNHTVVTMAKTEENKRQLRDRASLFVIGGLISTIIAWIVKGGLVE